MVSSDLGVKMSTSLIEYLKNKIKEGEEVSEDEFLEVIKKRLIDVLQFGDHDKKGIDIKALKRSLPAGTPVIIMIVGVNGVGKTTTVAKLASQFKNQGHTVMLAAADTFRAAAVEQLRTWGDRVGARVIYGVSEAKSATVVYDAVVAAKNEEVDVLIIDTAGRLHNKSNLMQELSGIKNSIARHVPNAPHESILVVDGSTGQNALSQAEQFNESTELSGLIVTKLDGTSKGGIVVAIKDQLGIPIRYIGVGESEDDLRPFDSGEFVDALLSTDDEPTSDVYTLTETATSAHSAVRRRRREA